MLEQMIEQNASDLDLSGQDRTIVTKIWFDRIIEQEGMCSLSPYVYEGYLLGVDRDGEYPVAIIGNLQISLYSGDQESDEPEIDLLIGEEEMARIPIREMNEVYGESATPGGWEAHARRGWDRD